MCWLEIYFFVATQLEHFQRAPKKKKKKQWCFKLWSLTWLRSGPEIPPPSVFGCNVNMVY